MELDIIQINNEVVCAKCGTQLTFGGFPLRDCAHYKWYIYGNRCFNCALNNAAPDCDFIADIEVCKEPLRRRVYTVEDGSTYYVLARK